MNKKLLIGAVAGGTAVAGIAATKKSQSEPKTTMWDKMRQHMEEMPEDFPPRIMFDNLEATKDNTEEILNLLRKESRQREDLQVVSSN